MATWLEQDPKLHEFEPTIRRAHANYEETLRSIRRTDGSLAAFAADHAYEYYGLHRHPDGGWVFREWAPAAAALSLVGDFNQWDPEAHPCVALDGGVFELFLPDVALPDGARAPLLRPGSLYKVALRWRSSTSQRGGTGKPSLYMPAWARACVQNPHTAEVCAMVPLDDAEAFPWRHPRPSKPPVSMRVYEVHPGIASVDETIATWAHLRTEVLPRVVRLGYTALLLLGVQQHGYYASFGYQVTSYFAPSERFGSPRELQELIDAAHAHGLLVLVELVHAHASSNDREGLIQDAQGGPYFLPGAAGHHPVWGTRIFDYSRTEVLRFLLANILWWVRAYRFDGFRLDAASTVLYKHRSLGERGSFSGAYHEYFGADAELDEAGYTYLKLANHLGAECRPPLVTVAEEHSGMPGLCAPVAELGVGFDFRQAMGIPSLWAHVLSLADAPLDASLPVDYIAAELSTSRAEERRLAYCECHDQSLVGDQALAFRLMGSAMYHCMERACTPPNAYVERGVALHKMARLATYGASADAYLNFIGNEFGHPEWLDMPCDANGDSFRFARRRWDLADDESLRYSQLLAFDCAMHAAEDAERWMRSAPPTREAVYTCTERQLMWFARGSTVFFFNWHASAGVDTELEVGADLEPLARLESPPRLMLTTDAECFGGLSRSVGLSFVHGRGPSRVGGIARLSVQLPAHVGVVFAC